MASRNLTKQFATFRASHKSIRSRVAGGVSKLFGDDAHTQAGAPPAFVPLVESLNQDLGAIKNQMGDLAKLYSKRLKVSFGGNEKEQDHLIEAKTRQVTKCELSLCQIFHAAETKLKRIAIIQHEPDVDATAASSQRRGAYESLPQQPVAAPPMSAQERAVRLNVMRAVGARVQDSTRQFRAMQKEFLSRLKGQEQTGNEFFASDREEPITLDELDMGYSQQQLAQIRDMEHTSSKRSQEIESIVKSINDLAELFKELSVLVVEQGSMLDRIDYNIESTLSSLKDGHKELDKAEQYGKSRGIMMCICMLVVAIFVLTGILVLKWM